MGHCLAERPTQPRLLSPPSSSYLHGMQTQGCPSLPPLPLLLLSTHGADLGHLELLPREVVEAHADSTAVGAGHALGGGCAHEVGDAARAGRQVARDGRELQATAAAEG